jgi:hypothetical protein
MGAGDIQTGVSSSSPSSPSLQPAVRHPLSTVADTSATAAADMMGVVVAVVLHSAASLRVGVCPRDKKAK